MNVARDSFWSPGVLQRVKRFLLGRGAGFYLALILVVGIMLRLFYLTHKSLWVDEGFVVNLASRDVSDILEAAAGSEDEPLFYILLHSWMLYLGRSVFVLRLFPVIWSVLSLVLLYETARLLFGSAVALIAALLLSLSPPDIWYAQEIGRFTLGTFLAMGSIYGFVNLLVGRRSLSHWVIYVVMTTAMVYTLYTSFAVVLAQNLYLLLAWIWLKRHRELVIGWIASQMGVVAAFLPWWPRFVEQTQHVGGVSLFMSVTRILEQLGITVRISGISLEYVALVIGVGMVVALILGKPLLFLWQRLFERPYVFVWSVPAYFAVLLVSTWNPVSSIRLVLLFLPPFLLAVAAGLNRTGVLSRPTSRNIWLGALIVPTLFSLGVNYFVNQKEDWRGAARLVESYGQPGDAVLLHPGYGDLPFDYHYTGSLPLERVNVKQLDQDLARLTEQYHRVWLLWAPGHTKHFDPDERLPKALEERGVLLRSYDLAYVRVRLYEFP